MESLTSGIQYRHWPVADARACVLLVHGLAEHTGRYHRLAAHFNSAGIAVVGPDHIGHGASPRSEGPCSPIFRLSRAADGAARAHQGVVSR